MTKSLRAFFPALIVLLLWGCGGAKPGLESTQTQTEPAKGVSGPDRQAEVMSLFLEATNARLAGQNAKAMQLYNRCLKLDPQNGAAYFELGKLYHQGQNKEQALDMSKRAVAADKTCRRGRCLSRHHRALAGSLRDLHRPGQYAGLLRKGE